jgi:hypothetical protein
MLSAPEAPPALGFGTLPSRQSVITGTANPMPAGISTRPARILP